MKKILVLLMVLLVSIPLWGDISRSIPFERLPGQAREFITLNFPDVGISYIREEANLWVKEYQVVFVNGCKVEFNRSGDWKEIDCKYTAVPLQAIPVKIRKYVEDKYPGQFITEIDRTSRKYEVKLCNGLEIEFDNDFNFFKYD